MSNVRPLKTAVNVTTAPQNPHDRRLVWEALSDMFLDTDASLTRAWRIQQLAQSPYSVGELEQILVEEIYPVLNYNLISVAGEWAGFDQEWLEREVLERRASRFYALHWLNLGRITMPRFSEWRITKSGVIAARGGNEPRVA